MISAPFQTAFPAVPYRSVVASIGVIIFVSTAIFYSKGYTNTATTTFLSGYAIFWVGSFMPPPVVQISFLILVSVLIVVPLAGIAHNLNNSQSE